VGQVEEGGEDMHGCVSVVVLLASALVYLVMLGFSFVYIVVLGIVWLVLKAYSKLVGKEEDGEDRQEESV
jgi:Na+-transporting methylmalonyl-CoA/oxaloacetate decarboxylase gamma subunit